MSSKKVKQREVIGFCLMALFAGITIGIGCTCFLLFTSLTVMPAFGKMCGGFLFALGIFAIISFEMKLFTGMVAGIPSMGKKDLWQLPVCFLCNALGVLLTATLIKFTAIGDTVVLLGAQAIDGKLNAEYWYINALISSIFCGILITMSILAPSYAKAKGLSATLGVVLPIIVFAFCGFDHSVANMFYFFSLGEVSWRVVGYILITIVGNILGGTAFPLVVNFKKRTQKYCEEEDKKENSESENQEN